MYDIIPRLAPCPHDSRPSYEFSFDSRWHNSNLEFEILSRYVIPYNFHFPASCLFQFLQLLQASIIQSWWFIDKLPLPLLNMFAAKGKRRCRLPSSNLQQLNDLDWFHPIQWERWKETGGVLPLCSDKMHLFGCLLAYRMKTIREPSELWFNEPCIIWNSWLTALHL